MKSMKSYEKSPDHLYRTQPFPRATTNRPCRKRPAAAAGEALLGANAPHEVLGLDILKFVETLTYTVYSIQAPNDRKVFPHTHGQQLGIHGECNEQVFTGLGKL